MAIESNLQKKLADSLFKELATPDFNNKGEKLEKITLSKLMGLRPKLAKSLVQRIELVNEKLEEDINFNQLYFGSVLVANRGGLLHDFDVLSTEVELLRAVGKSKRTGAVCTIEWKQGLSPMGTMWFIKYANWPKTVFPGGTFNKLALRILGK